MEVRFFLYQKPDGKVATVLDACEICGPVGFYKGSQGVICKNCAAPINPQSVGMPGGCNPIPLKAEVTGDAIVISRGRFCGGPPLLRAGSNVPAACLRVISPPSRRKLLAGIAITLGVTVATAMIAVATDIGDKINRELRSYGANLVVTPQEDTLDVEIGGVNLKPPSDGAFLNEADLPKIRGTFWHHNIVGFSPMLPVTVKLGDADQANVRDLNASTEEVTLLGTYFNKRLIFGKEEFTTGVRVTHPWWKVEANCGNGATGGPARPAETNGGNCGWPNDNSEAVLLGERLAAKLNKHAGDTVVVNNRRLPVSGILSTGSAEDNEIVAPLAIAQQIMGKPGAVRRVYVSALTKPPDALSAQDPKHNDARGSRSLVLLALCRVHRLPASGGHPALARRANSPGRAE